MKLWLATLTLTVLSLSALDSHAKPKVPSGKLFGGAAVVTPTQVNDEAVANGLKKISTTLIFGIEATYPILPVFDIGVRYFRNQVNRDEDPSDYLHDYKVYFTQDILMAVGRIPIVKTNILRIDIFGAYGAAMNTTLKMETATQMGELSKPGFEKGIGAYGGSISIGYKNFFVFVEGGGMSNVHDGFKRSGTINENIRVADFSGSYTLVGIAFVGDPPGSSKK